jgi:hypothetical protein
MASPTCCKPCSSQLSLWVSPAHAMFIVINIVVNSEGFLRKRTKISCSVICL